MATERVPMRKIREILRLKWVAQRSHREVARSLGVSAGTVAAAVGRARARALTWEAVEALSDDALERQLFGAAAGRDRRGSRPEPDLAWLHQELRRPGVTLELLHVEYLAAHPTGYRYSAFCGALSRLARAAAALDAPGAHRRRESLRRLRGDAAHDRRRRDRRGDRRSSCSSRCSGASNYTFAEATRTQQSADWILSHAHAVEYFGGVPAVWVPDQLRTGVTVPCRYEPGVQRTYAEWAAALSHGRHSGASRETSRQSEGRSRRAGGRALDSGAAAPRDLLLSSTRSMRRIRELLTALNARPMKTYGGVSRRDLFERFDRPALQALPAERFVHGDWLQARVNIDYHVEVDHHYYSVPHPLIHAVLDVRLSATTVEIFQRGTRVWLHARSYVRGRHTTVPEHMPKAHRAHLEWSPSRLLRWGATIGAATEALVQQILESRPHPEQGYRSCLGLLRLAKQVRPRATECRLRPCPSRRRPLVSPCRHHAQARVGSPAPADRRPPRPHHRRPMTTSAVPRTTTKESPS